MTILSKIKYCFERLLSEIYAARSHDNNQQVCIVVLNQGQRKISPSVKIVVGQFYCARLSKFFI